MGVDYYTCQNCGQTYADCSYYFTCTNCESGFCSDKCGGRKVEKASASGKYWDDETSCVLCREEVIPDSDMVNFLLNRLGMTRTQAEELYRNKSKTILSCSTCNANPPGPQCPLKCDENH
jgi:hypothetical protein